MKASWFHTSGRYLAGTWLHSCRQSLRMDRTARGCGQVRRSSQSHKSQLHNLSQRQIEMKFFIATLSTVQVGAFSLFYLQAASQTHAFDAGDTMWRPSSSGVRHKTRSLLLFVLRPKSTLTQAQLHVHWTSKST